MKQSTQSVGKLLSLFSLLALLSVGFVSCSGDDDDFVNPGQGKPSTSAGLLDKSTGLRITSVGSYSFEYDSKGRLDYVKTSSSRGYRFSYNPNKIYYNDSEKEAFLVGYNDSGYLASMSYTASESGEELTGMATLSYDDEGHLVQVNQTYTETENEYGKRYKGTEQSTLTLTWKNGLLTKAIDKWTWKDDEESGTETLTWTFEYSDNAMENYYNKYLQMAQSVLRPIDIDDNFPYIGYIGLFGKGPKYLPSSAQCEKKRDDRQGNRQSQNQNTQTYNFDYGFNNDGSINYCSFNGSRQYYTYDHSGGSSHKAPLVVH